MSTNPAPTEAATPDAVAQPVATTVAQHMLVAGQAADNDLHDAIMRIPAKSSPYPNYTAGEVIAHMQGHRDARHAAAELVSAHAAAADAAPAVSATRLEGDALVNAMCKAGLANDHGRRTLLNGEEIGFDLISLMAIVRLAATAAPGGAPKRPLPPRDQSLPNGGLEPDWNGYALAEKEAAAQGDAKHLVDAVTAVMSQHGLIDHLTPTATERFCDELLATFTANAEQGVVLPSSFPPAPQGYAWRRGMNSDLSDAINKLALNDAVAHASLRASIVQGLNQADTLAHIVLNLAASKGQLEAELYQLAALSPPGKAAL